MAAMRRDILIIQRSNSFKQFKTPLCHPLFGKGRVEAIHELPLRKNRAFKVFYYITIYWSLKETVKEIGDLSATLQLGFCALMSMEVE